MNTQLMNGGWIGVLRQFDAASVAASSLGTGRKRLARVSRRAGKRAQTARSPHVCLELIVERSDALRCRREIVSLGGRALECLVCAPVHGSTCVRLCIDLAAGSEEAMNRIVRSVESGDRAGSSSRMHVAP